MNTCLLFMLVELIVSWEAVNPLKSSTPALNSLHRTVRSSNPSVCPSLTLNRQYILASLVKLVQKNSFKKSTRYRSWSLNSKQWIESNNLIALMLPNCCSQVHFACRKALKGVVIINFSSPRPCSGMHNNYLATDQLRLSTY